MELAASILRWAAPGTHMETIARAANEFVASSSYNMARCSINGHRGFLPVTFQDWLARKVGVKELWTLKGPRKSKTRGPWTKAGGVNDSDWPKWIWPFKDFRSPLASKEANPRGGPFCDADRGRSTGPWILRFGRRMPVPVCSPVSQGNEV